MSDLLLEEAPALVEVGGVKPRSSRRSACVDLLKGEYVLDGRSYLYAGLPAASAGYCGLMGLARVLSGSSDPDAAYAALSRGEVPATRGHGSGPRELDPWRRAFSKALLAKVNPKKGPEVMTAAEAEDRARGLGAADMRAIKADPDVVRAYRGLVEIAVTPLEAAVAALQQRG